MFKLAKIINSGTNVPEPIRLPKALTFEIVAMTPLTLFEGGLLPFENADGPAYFPLENSSADDNDKVLCFKTQPNMLFEVPLIGDPENVYVGALVELYCANGVAVGVTDQMGLGACEIVDLCGATASGDKILVKFIL